LDDLSLAPSFKPSSLPPSNSFAGFSSKAAKEGGAVGFMSMLEDSPADLTPRYPYPSLPFRFLILFLVFSRQVREWMTWQSRRHQSSLFTLPIHFPVCRQQTWLDKEVLSASLLPRIGMSSLSLSLSLIFTWILKFCLFPFSFLISFFSSPNEDTKSTGVPKTLFGTMDECARNDRSKAMMVLGMNEPSPLSGKQGSSTRALPPLAPREMAKMKGAVGFMSSGAISRSAMIFAFLSSGGIHISSFVKFQFFFRDEERSKGISNEASPLVTRGNATPKKEDLKLVEMAKAKGAVGFLSQASDSPR
jgi:hypothetical protein